MSRFVGLRTSTILAHAKNAKNLHLECLKITCQILNILLLWRAVLMPDLGSPNSSTWTAATHPSMKEAALRAAPTKGGGRLRRPPPFVDSFMDGCVAAVQVEEFGLPKSGVSMARHRSKFFRICHVILQHSKSRKF